jgi:hypothetical protein
MEYHLTRLGKRRVSPALLSQQLLHGFIQFGAVTFVREQMAIEVTLGQAAALARG